MNHANVDLLKILIELLLLIWLNLFLKYLLSLTKGEVVNCDISLDKIYFPLKAYRKFLRWSCPSIGSNELLIVAIHLWTRDYKFISMGSVEDTLSGWIFQRDTRRVSTIVIEKNFVGVCSSQKFPVSNWQKEAELFLQNEGEFASLLVQIARKGWVDL